MAVSSNSTAADTVVQGPGAAEPIAVIGLACRLPGAPDPHGLWKLLSEGRSAVTERPVGRTGDSDGAAAQAHPGLRFGGYLPAIDGFDPEFFGISPREAAAMDPQQRLVLELSWEAIEDAGLLPAALRGGATGVFIGSIADEYAALSRAAGPGRHTLTGTTRGIIANRVSHTLGLRGPSIAVDTAQSSSLVAVHLACESLRRGEAALALAGGVNLIVDPLGSVAVAQFGGLSPDGRCYTFDRRANGYVRAEGAGLVLLKPLAAALADGDRVHAVILGSAVNNDGGGTGLTVPSERAQAAVIRKACAAAGVTPGDLQYVELHGTGTPVGDPLEARGLWLARAEGAGPVDGETAPEVLDVGSVKTNLGHLEGAAGIAGLLKAVLGVARRELPATLNHDDPNPEIDLVGWRLRVRTRLGAWPRPERPLLAGVSSFGMGGTNCHVVLGEAPRAVESASATDASLGPILLSGRTVPALRAQAARLRDALDGGAGLRVDEGTADAEGGAGEGQDRLLPTGLAYALATRRTAFRERAAVTGVADAAGLRSALDALAHGRPAAGVLSGSAHGEGTVALLFPGQGSQRGGMARLAGAQSQVWRAALAQAAEVLDPWLPEPVEGLLFADPGSPQAALLDRTEYTQPALFAVEVATARYLASLGVTPAFVAGHSIGEVAAAHLAGVLDLPSAARLIAARGRLMGALPSGGGMLGIGASEADVTAMIASLGDSVAIAAVNGPSSVVVAGPKELLVELAEQCDARNVRTRPLAVSHAFHSPLMEPMLDEFREELRQLTFNDVSLPFVSTVTGELMAGEAAAGHDWVEHWVEHARRPVRFADALRCLRELGVGAFVEAGPGTVLSGLGREITGSTAHIPVLGKDGDLDGALARLFTSGVELDWRQALPNPDGRWVELPGYAFQRERYWLDNSGGQSESAPTAAPVSAPAAEPPAELAARMLPAAPDGGVIDRLVLAELAATLGFTDPARVDPDTTFKDLGLDSLGLVEFRDRLGAALGRELPAGVLFGHPTATALSGFLRAPVAARPSAAAVSAGGSDDPVVIVGMGCRFPGGVSSPEELWELVASGADATGDFPTDRGWDLEALFAGASATRRGGFLHDVAEFDAGFFGISPREAAAMDPQQRLLLQVSWEALERAGIDPHALKDTDTGVFIGASPSDYTPRLHEADDASVGGYLLTGSALSVASGRIAYVLGLRGRALTVDTACSSSLVALDLAVRAVRSGECGVALAGGVAVMASPGMFVEFSRQGGLSVDGRCRAFGDGAGGTGWAEGVGVVVVERLSRARASGHRVLAVVAGSAVNQDGASNGLTAPSGRAQEEVIGSALADAGLSGVDVDVVEAHGTGTVLGDPIEAQALIGVYGGVRRFPLFVGSLKSNVGHAQAAAGVGGVIKAVEALRRGVLPRTLFAQVPSRHVRWEGSGVEVLREERVWPEVGRPRRAGVSSFGISGTNAHVILEQAPEEPEVTASRLELPPPVLLSATDAPALARQADALLSHLDRNPDAEPRMLAAALAHRSRHPYGAGVLTEDRATLRAALRALAEGEVHDALLTGERAAGRAVFVFPGQGSQWPAMARELLESSPVFLAEIEACAATAAEFVDWDLVAVLRGDPGAPSLERVDVVQPALFAVMVGLAALWRAAGVEPEAVVGHSQGEIAAAYVAGALSLRDAVKLVTLRSQALLQMAGAGGMVSVALGVDALRPILAQHEGELEIAVRNGPTATVVAGGDSALGELLAWCERQGARARRIPVDYASHTSHVEPLREELLRIGADLEPRSGAVAYYSGVTGGELPDTAVLDAEYWYRNLRETVRFEDVVHSLIDAGHRRFVEVSPHPVLTFAVDDILAAREVRAFAAGTLRRDHGGPAGFRRALTAAELGGLPVAWSSTPPAALPATQPPTYSFAADRHWLAPQPGRSQSEGLGSAGERHPLLSTLVPLAEGGGMLLTGRIDGRTEPWLSDHQVLGTVLVPGTAFLELILKSGQLIDAAEVRELTVLAPLTLADGYPVQLQLMVGAPNEDGCRTADLHARTSDALPWTRHATALLAPVGSDPASWAPAAWLPAGAVPVDVSGVYQDLYARGYDYGPAFQGLTAAWRSGGRLYVEIAAVDMLTGGSGPAADAFTLHPAQLDAALHPVVAGLLDDGSAEPQRPLLPFAFEGLRMLRSGHDGGALRVVIEPLGGARFRFAISDESGAPLAEIAALAFRSMDRAQLAGGQALRTHRIDWQPVGEVGTTPVASGVALLTGLGDAALVTGATRVAGSLADLLTAGPPPELLVVPIGRAAGDGTSDPITAAHAWTSAALSLLQRWLAEPAPEPGSRLQFVAPADELATGAVRGLIRSAAAEHPDRVGLTVVDGPTPVDLIAAHLTERETEVRRGAVLVPRLVVVEQTPSDPAPTTGRADVKPTSATGSGTALITGGTGALGAVVARHLAARPEAPHLLLVSRSGPQAPGAAELVAELRTLGAEATVAACDVTDRTALADLLAAIPADRPLRSVIHAAGLLADALIADLTPDQLHAVLRPKVDAGWLLHDLTLAHPVTEFVLFSSAVGTLGVPGQANYAAGNAFLDALARHRRAAGLPAVALAWGLWEETGAMTGHLGAADWGRLARYGIGPVPTTPALDLLDAVPDRSQLVVSPWDETVLRAEAMAGRLPALFSSVVRVPMTGGGKAASGRQAWARRLAAVPVHDRLRILTGLLREQVAQVLGHQEADSIASERAFKELGFDSLTAVELRNRINALSGLTLPATVVFEYPTLAALAGHLFEALGEPGSREVRQAVAAAVSAGGSDDPVVIVGMGCRFPGGVSSPEELWELVASGADATGDFPTDRGWDLEALYHPDPEHRGTTYTRRGGFLYDAGEFDAAFFGMSPREALATDPQQRLLLQVSWEALERAGIDPHTLKDTDTGVFIGAMYDDYGSRLHQVPEEVEGLLLAGNESSVASGRIAYVLGLRGRALTVDTACSSSLVALDLAVRAVRSGECGVALAGGVAVMASPGMFVEFSRQGGLSVDGRCRAFGDGAGGTGWAEGVGVVVVERLSRARASGHRVLAVVAGSAVNQDGASNGLTAPSGRAQEEVIGSALADAGLSGVDVDVVEAHGTGTVLGDPIEAQALIGVYGGVRRFPLFVGSLKSNVGHAQAAAGVGGVIKAVEALRRGVLPRTLFAQVPSRHVRWEGSGVEVLREERVWPEVGRPRRAGVSSFGISGTNAHVILEQAPEEPEVTASRSADVVPLLLSAKTPTALRAQADALLTHLDDHPVELLDLGYTLARRARFDQRAVAHVADLAQAREALTAVRDAARHPAVRVGRARGGQGLAVLFSGQGSQRLGMGVELLRESAEFARAFDEVAGVLDPLIGIGLRDLVGRDAAALRETRYAQPALFAVETALYRLAEFHGVRPGFLIGHSIGEVAAAHVAGVLDLPDACALVAARGRLMQSAPAGGGMAAFAADEAEGAGLVAAADGAVELAAVNGPTSIVLAGAADALDRLVANWKAQGRKATRLRVSHAFHSTRMEPVLADFREAIAELTFAEPVVPVISSVTGAMAEPGELATPEYWVEQIRRPVRFLDALRAANRLGVTRFVEAGPDGSLAALVDTDPSEDTGIAAPVAVALLRPGRPEVETVRSALAELHVAGVPVDFGQGVADGQAVDLPVYPFETRRYWLQDAPQPPRIHSAAALGVAESPHPLLPAALELPDGVRLFTGTLTTEGQPWLADHRIDGRVLLPAAVLTELALAAGAAAGRAHVRELLISAPLEIHGGTGTTVQLLVTDDGGLVVRARTAAGDWQTHATGQLEAASGDGDSDTPLTEPQHWEELFDGDGPAGAYRRLAAAGYGYGSAFQGLQSARQAGSELEAEIEVPIAGDADRYGVHPALLDAALHAMVLHGLQRGGPRLVPYALEGVRLHRPHATRLRARLYQVGDQAYRVELSDPAGRAVLTVERLRLRALPSGAALHRLEWRAVPTPEADGTVAEQVELLRVGTTDPYHAAELARAAVQARLAASDAAGLLAFVTDAGRTADPHAEPASAALWGLVRAAQKENPGRFGLVHADRAIADELLATVALAHPQAVLTGAELRVPHAVRLPADVPGEPAESRPEGEPGIRWPRSADGGTVLITGGTGALGRLTARRLVSRHGVRNIVLVSRRGPRHPDAAAAVAELAALGAHAEVRACDLADRAAVAALIAGLTAPLSAVVHAAGIAQDTVVERLTADSLRQTLDAKTRAAVHLDELTAGLELDAFVLYGSVAGVFGTAGQAAYCAANASLEGIARRRRTMGRPALVLHWGLWALRTGLAAALGERDLARLDRAGIRPMAEADGLALLDRALRLDSVALIAAHLVHVEPEHRAAVHTAREVSARPVRTPRPGADPVRIVLEAVAEVLGHPAGTVLDAELAFTDLGIDSLTAVELRNRLNSALGLRLPSAVVFDHPNPVALAEFVAAQLELPPAQLERPEPTSPFRAALGTRDRDVADDPIAIVGMACRFPGGVRTPDEFWQLLADGVDAITEFPTDRGWDPDLFHPDPTHPGTSATRFGGFLHDAAEFDPAFFGISPREALAVDPQQRLLLETAWEAVESSGIDPTTLRGSDAGVFVGVMYADYGARLHQHPGSARELEGYLVSGSAGSVASGRIAYTLGLQGPAVTVDTACSSSLVALHQAAQALRSGECSLALVGGATVMASPATFVEFSRQQGLAADGRCKPFADTADGTAWGEGVGLLLVERLSDARRRGHQVLAVVRGSAVNQDGASNGLTAPNGPAQQRVIQRALDNAELTAAQVDVLQAHGTGTRLGDPIEAGAVLSVYGAARGADDPLLMGSVKSNIGHTQAAAGVAGIMAMVQAMRHGVVPGTLHLDRPSQQVDWSAGTVAVPTGPTPWPSRPGPRRAAVSSFGISGTNAHVILEGVTEPEVRPAAAPAGHPVPWLLSARTPEALREQAAKLREFVSGPGASETDVDLAYSLATTRTAFEHRAMVVGRDRGELLAGLRVLAEGGRPEPGGFPIVVTGSAVRGETAVLFTGQGSQRIGMGSALHAAFPVYARAFDEIAELFADREGLDLPALLQGTGGELDRTRHAQAALFAVEVALFRLLESWGLPGGPVAGHSIGELAAAHLAQALSLPDAVALVGIRGRLMGRLPDGGAMVAVQADPETVASTATRLAVTVDIAAINTPGSVVVSGAAEPVAALTAALTADGRRTRPLKVSHAFHSALMEPVLPGFRSEVDELKLGEGSLTRTVVSTLTGREASAAALSSADHWSGQLRGTVRFSDAVQRLRELGAARLLEIGPDAALTALVEQSELGPQTVALATLDRRRDDIEALWRFFAQAQIAGVDWDWRSVLGDDARTVPLPTYAFVHERLWLLPPLPEQQTYADGLGAEAPGHPLLAAAVVDPDGVHAGYTGVLSHRRLPWLADHALHGTPVLPAAALVDLLGWLADRHGRPGIIEISLLAPVVIADRQELRLRVTVTGSTVRVHAAPAGEPWVLHAEAQLAEPGAPLPQAELSPERPADALPVPLDGVYRALAERGYDYGPAFRGLRALWRTGTDTLYAEVDTADRLAVGLLDAALHAWPAAALGRPEAERDGIEVPASWHGITVHRAPTGALRVRMTRTGEAVFALAVTDVTGAAVLTVEEVRLRPLDRTGLDSAGSGRLYTVAWEAVRPEEAAACEGVAVVALDHGDVRADLREARRLLLAAPEQDHLVLVTTGAVAACPADGLPGVDQAALWGLVRTAQQEFPGRVSVIDTDGSAESEARLRGLAGTRPGQLALRQGQAYRPRLAPVASGTAGVDPGLRERLAVGTVLVTGAGGALGSAVARHLAHEYRVRRLLLVSRRGDADPALRALAAELADHTEVRTAACDLADGAAVRDLIAAETVTGIALSGVVHAAGVLDDAVLANMTDDQVDRVLKPKVDAARHLHELLGGQELAVFVLFSSIAGVLGNAGQGAYAAANAYLDALAAHRRAAGLPGTSLAWGLWESAAEGVGMGGGLAGSAAARIERLGIRPLTEAAGLELFDQALSLGPDHALLVPARLDRSALARRDGELPQLLADLVPNRPSAAEAGPIPAASTTRTLAERLAGLDPVATEEAAAALVRGAVAEVLGLAPGSSLPEDRGLFDLGLDSLTAIELRNRLGAELAERLPTTVLFDRPTVRALTGLVMERLAAARPAFDRAVFGGWVAAAADLPGDDGRRAEMRRALEAAIARLSDGRDEPVPVVGDPAFGMDSVSDDELFGLLDRELGD